MTHITQPELIAVILGILACWILKWSKEKDEFDKQKQEFSTWKWLKDWFRYRNDNIFAHLVVSLSTLYIGVENLRIFLGDNFNLPETYDELGSAYIIGFFGSYLAEILKKAL